MFYFACDRSFIASNCTGSDEATLEAWLRVYTGEQLMSVGDVLLRLGVMVVRCGVVRPSSRSQARVRIVAGPGGSQGVVVMRMRCEVDAERRRPRSGRLRHAVRRRKVRWLEVRTGVSSDVARHAVAGAGGTSAGGGRSTVLRGVQRPQLTRWCTYDEVASVLLLQPRTPPSLTYRYRQQNNSKKLPLGVIGHVTIRLPICHFLLVSIGEAGYFGTNTLWYHKIGAKVRCPDRHFGINKTS